MYILYELVIITYSLNDGLVEIHACYIVHWTICIYQNILFLRDFPTCYLYSMYVHDFHKMPMFSFTSFSFLFIYMYSLHFLLLIWFITNNWFILYYFILSTLFYIFVIWFVFLNFSYFIVTFDFFYVFQLYYWPFDYYMLLALDTKFLRQVNVLTWTPTTSNAIFTRIGDRRRNMCMANLLNPK